MNTPRAYSMAVRGAQAERTRERILDAARSQMDDRTSEFTVAGVAEAAGVSVQTVLRAFGSRDGLAMAAIASVRQDVPGPADLPGSLREAVTRIVDDYEEIGDRVLWMLEREHRVAGFDELAAEGRRRHRDWVRAALADHLDDVPADQHQEVLSGLLVAVDVYTWKLLRRDFRLSRTRTISTMERLARGVLDQGDRPT